MIPKKIHYCWFGGQPIPDKMKSFIATWYKYCPDYEFIKWDENNFDVNNSIPFVREAYKHKKYAFVSDYARLCALYNEGGIYLDTDIVLIKPLDAYLNNRFFTSIEYIEDNVRILNVKNKLNKDGTKKNINDVIIGIGIVSAIFGSEAKHPYILDCINFYNGRHFILPDGSFYDKIILTVSMALCAEKYGFRYINCSQNLREGIHLYPNDYFTHISMKSKNSIALHMAYNSWRNKDLFVILYDNFSKIFIFRKIKRALMNIPYIGSIIDKINIYIWFRKK